MANKQTTKTLKVTLETLQKNWIDFRLEFTGTKTEDSLLALLNNYTRAESLTLNRRNPVTNDILKTISTSFENLKHLKLKNCRHITNAGLWHILKHCKNLQTITIANCPGITTRFLAAETHYLPSTITITYSNKLDVEEKQKRQFKGYLSVN